jgi:2-polyprenyl-3-methyl-5-hydroxy-6-metoxy-1,4-benzoquinol methylase
VGMVASDINRRTSDERFSYHRCPACGLMFVAPAPADMSRFYPSDYVTPPKTVAELHRIANQIRYELDLLQKFVAGGRLLEIGPGYGSFLWLAKDAGFQVEAIDADAAACDYLTRTLGVRTTTTATPHVAMSALPEASYSAIVQWHSIEHLPDPWETLRQAARLLRPGGVIIIATPNPDAWQFSILRQRWPHVDAPRHLWLIPMQVLAGSLAEVGVTLADVTTRDQGGRKWDQFGWSQTVLNLFPPSIRRTLPARAFTRLVGHAAALIFYPWEKADMKGSAYTAVFRKADGSGTSSAATS